jgi:hypothetical protein
MKDVIDPVEVMARGIDPEAFEGRDMTYHEAQERIYAARFCARGIYTAVLEAGWTLAPSKSPQFAPGYVARLLACQSKLVEALNTAINTLGLSSNEFSAQNARQARDEALALAYPDTAASEAGWVLVKRGQVEADERAHMRTLEERDAVQELFDELYVAFFGDAPEYSNLFNATDAFNEMDARLSQLKAAMIAAASEAGKGE